MGCEWEVLTDVRVLADQEPAAGGKSPGIPKLLEERPLLASIIIVRLILYAVKVQTARPCHGCFSERVFSS